MTKINTGGSVEYAPTKSNKFNKMLYTIALALSLGYSSPANAQSTTSNADNNDNIELTTSVSNHKENHGGYSIPPIYKDKIESILKENLPVVSIDGTSSWMFTIDFVLKEKEADWGISKDNQLFFIWLCICEVLTDEYPYDGGDGDSKKLEEFEKAFAYIDACGKRYKELIMPFIEKKIAENKQKIADNEQKIADNEQKIADNEQKIADNEQKIADNEQKIADNEQKIADNIKEIMRLDSVGIKNMVSFYQKRDELTDEQKDKLADGFKQLVKDCSIRGIDPKNIILNEVKAKYPHLKEPDARTIAKSVIDYWGGGYKVIF